MIQKGISDQKKPLVHCVKDYSDRAAALIEEFYTYGLEAAADGAADAYWAA